MRERVQRHLDTIYRDNPLGAKLTGLADELLELMGLDASACAPQMHVNHWDQRDAMVITYGDSVLREGSIRYRP